MTPAPYCVSVFAHIPDSLRQAEADQRSEWGKSNSDPYWCPWNHPAGYHFCFRDPVDVTEVLSAASTYDFDRPAFSLTAKMTRHLMAHGDSRFYDEWTGLYLVVVRAVRSRVWYANLTTNEAFIRSRHLLAHMTRVPEDVVLDGYTVTLAELSTIG